MSRLLCGKRNPHVRIAAPAALMSRSTSANATDVPLGKRPRRSRPSPSERLRRIECYETLLKKRTPDWNLIRLRMLGPGLGAWRGFHAAASPLPETDVFNDRRPS